MSMPALTPALVTRSPSSTKREATSVRTVGSSSDSRFSDAQCVVARRPTSRPAAANTRLPVHTDVIKGTVGSHLCVHTGTEQFQALIEWYLANHGDGSRPSVGFFQIGGGIAGDFAICAVPCISQDLGREVPVWGYFCQITDARPSYGGYSGAPANEKITWGKLSSSTPRFDINSDAAIVAPLIFGYVLGD